MNFHSREHVPTIICFHILDVRIKQCTQHRALLLPSIVTRYLANHTAHDILKSRLYSDAANRLPARTVVHSIATRRLKIMANMGFSCAI